MSEKIDDLFFYLLDKTIKTHRQYTQNRLRAQGYPVTIDQWLLLTAVSQQPDLTQAELCGKVFKDKGSLNRMIEVMTAKGWLKKEESKTDRRKSKVKLTPQGQQLLRDIRSIVRENRRLSLEGIAPQEIQSVKTVLHRIIANCNKHFEP